MQVRFERWIGGICIEHGMMPVKEVQKALQEHERVANKLLHESDADHVIYGYKQYDKNDGLHKVCFYQETALTEEEFLERTKGVTGIVYALHKRK